MDSELFSNEPSEGTGGTDDVEASTPEKRLVLSPSDVNLLRGLDEEYINVVNETEVEIKARMIWAFRSAGASVCVMAIYLVAGVTFFSWQTDWKLLDVMLFCVYTVTSAGYGHVDIPQTAAVQIFIIVYIMFGIANLAVLVAQVYQYAALRASRLLAQASRRKALQARKRKERFACDDSTTGSTCMEKAEQTLNRHPIYYLIERVFQKLSKFKDFLNYTDAGQVLSVVLPLLAIHLSGSIAVGAVEGWNFRESVYFGIVSMTTVGYGDYVPSTNAGIIVCLFWLPWNVVFLSIYMAGVAQAYFFLARKSISRIERSLKLHHATEKKLGQPLSTKGAESKDKIIDLEIGGEHMDHVDKHLAPSSLEPSDEASKQDRIEGGGAGDSGDGSDDGSCAGDGDSNSGTCDANRESRSIQTGNADILTQVPANENQYIGFSSEGAGALETMMDVVAAVHAYSNGTLTSNRNDGTGRPISSRHLEVLFLPTPSSARQAPNTSGAVKVRSSGKEKPLRLRTPCFVVRVLVKERLAKIIARELAGSHLTVDMREESAISIKLGRVKEIASKWSIPLEARQSFRAVAFEALLFVGEKSLLQHGAKALLNLRPDEFHHFFSPLLAQMGDADSFEAWLANTEDLAKCELGDDVYPDTDHDLHQSHHKLVIADDLGKLSTNIGNAFQK